MGWHPKVVFLFIGLPILGVCAATLYYLNKKDDNEWEEFGAICTNRSNVIEVKVPSEHVGTVIGRAGVNIKEIQERTNTKINFKDAAPDADYRICRIRGTAEGTQMAESLIHEAIANQPVIETLEIWVPQKACGRIIGRCGDNIRAISKQSNAQINVDRTTSNKGNKDTKQVIIKGTAEQIAVAKSLIEEKIEEDDIARGKMQLMLENRQPRNTPNKTKKRDEERRYERLMATNSDNNMIQVYVSSVANPTHFWLQLISPRAVDLDHLVEEMTDYYSKERNRELHKLKEVVKGQVVASQFENDDKWYRVEVCGIEEKENPEESVVDVIYVDYGDSAFYKMCQLYQLRTDFLQLRFQAIECSIAGIKPKGEDWSEESISAFEDLCYTAQWKSMTAQIVGYKKRKRSNREGSPVPCVKLYDPSCDGLDVAKELIKKGLADSAPETEPKLNLEGEEDENVQLEVETYNSLTNILNGNH